MDERAWASDIVISNASRLDDNDVARIAEACRQQVKEHVEPAYGLRAVDVRFVPRNEREGLTKGSHVVMVFDNEGQAQEEGFCGTNSEDPELGVYGVGVIREDGLSYSRVFADLSTENGRTNLFKGPRSVSCSVSHEVIEARVDGCINRWAVGSDGRLYAYEACDAVENDAYEIRFDDDQAVSVSDFVLPRWFDPWAEGGHFDFMKKLRKPFSRRRSGYVLVYDPREKAPKVKMEPDEGLLDDATRNSKRSPLARTRWRSGDVPVRVPGIMVS
jgi:hypothetical protein